MFIFIIKSNYLSLLSPKLIELIRIVPLVDWTVPLNEEVAFAVDNTSSVIRILFEKSLDEILGSWVDLRRVEHLPVPLHIPLGAEQLPVGYFMLVRRKACQKFEG